MELEFSADKSLKLVTLHGFAALEGRRRRRYTGNQLNAWDETSRNGARKMTGFYDEVVGGAVEGLSSDDSPGLTTAAAVDADDFLVP